VQLVYYKVHGKYHREPDKDIGRYGTPDEVIKLVNYKGNQYHIQDIEDGDLWKIEEKGMHLRS
jgi:hypothetical protein